MDHATLSVHELSERKQKKGEIIKVSIVGTHI
jgi:hypothetical protein